MYHGTRECTGPKTHFMNPNVTRAKPGQAAVTVQCPAPGVLLILSDGDFFLDYSPGHREEEKQTQGLAIAAVSLCFH